VLKRLLCQPFGALTTEASTRLHGATLEQLESWAKERLRALNSHAVQFRYEGCPAENVSSSECHVLTSSLEK